MSVLKTFGLLIGISALFTGCGINPTDPTYHYNPNLPHGYVYDACGDSLLVNWKFDPNEPGDSTKLIFDSVTVLGVRYEFNVNRQMPETIQTFVKVPIRFVVNRGRWEMDYSEQLREDAHVVPVPCFDWGKPEIITQPGDAVVEKGDSAVFEVAATDGGPRIRDPHNFTTCTWTLNEKPVESNSPGSCRLEFTPTAHADSGAKIKAVVSNGYYTVASRTATLTVIPAWPRVSSLKLYQIVPRIDTFTGDTLGTDTLQASYIAPGRTACVKVTTIKGAVTTYSWKYKGVPVTASGDRLVLTNIPKSDSGSVVQCTVANSFGSDAASLTMNFHYPALSAISGVLAGTPSSTTYGSLLDLDFDGNYEINGKTASTTTADKVDLVVNYAATPNPQRFFLLAPRKAKKMGISSVSSLDSNQMARTKMVLAPYAQNQTEDGMRNAYAQGVLLDSVAIEYINGGFYVNGSVNESYVVVAKTSTGRYIWLQSTGFYSGNTAVYFYLVRGMAP